MFNKDEKEETVMTPTNTTGSADTVIGSTVKVEGNLQCDDTILIDGKFVGTITTSKHITIGQDAEVEGNLKADAVYMSGTVRGNIVASNTMELSGTAQLYGDLKTDTLSVEKGAVVQGQCITGAMESSVSQAQLSDISTEEQPAEVTSVIQ
jgi:cytoskeletal protein CcmA (bactofilin family)